MGAGTLIAKGMADKGCKVSHSKSVILATDSELASLVQQGIMQGAGICLPIVQTARDLGIDSGFSKRRRIPTAAGRVKKSLAKLKRLQVLATVTSKARRLYRTGVIPQIAWGQEAKGLAPTVVQHFRTRSGKGTCVRKPGGCLTTALAVGFGPSNDPAQGFTVNLLQVWCRLWAAEPKWQAAIAEVWNRIKARLQD
jgi:hypothetical protein